MPTYQLKSDTLEDGPFLTYEELKEAVSPEKGNNYPVLEVTVLLLREHAESSLEFLNKHNLKIRDLTRPADEELVLLVHVPRESLHLLGKLPRNWVRFEVPEYLVTLLPPERGALMRTLPAVFTSYP